MVILSFHQDLGLITVPEQHFHNFSPMNPNSVVFVCAIREALIKDIKSWSSSIFRYVLSLKYKFTPPINLHGWH